MLSGARLWHSATSALSSLNENITSALDNLDGAVEDEIDHHEHEDECSEEADSELETYKKMLDDAQMQHVELSKQLRQIVSEKDAEILSLKRRIGVEDVTDRSSGTVPISDLIVEGVSVPEFERLKADKESAELNLEMVELQLRETLRESNEAKAAALRIGDLKEKLTKTKEELTLVRQEAAAKDSQKSETIENLVAEYSKLAAESELRHTGDVQRIEEVVQENEILVTKLHALEHSITELADRTVTTSSVDAAGIVQELKEARAKIINLQYDLKEKDDEIAKLSAIALGDGGHTRPDDLTNPRGSLSPKSSPARSNSGKTSSQLARSPGAALSDDEMERTLQKALQEVEDLKADVARLQLEKVEAEDAGKRAIDDTKAINKELAATRKDVEEKNRLLLEKEALVTRLAPLEEELRLVQAKLSDHSGHSSSSVVSTAAVASADLLQELANIKESLRVAESALAASDTAHTTALAAAAIEHENVLAASRVDHEAALLVFKQQLASAEASHEAAIQAALQASGPELAAKHAEYAAALHSLEQQLAAEKTTHASALATADGRIAAMQDEHVVAIKALDEQLAAGKAELEKLRQETEAHVAKLHAAHELAMTESTGKFQQKQDELTGSLLAVKDELALKEGEFEAALKAAAEGLSAERALVVKLKADVSRLEGQLEQLQSLSASGEQSAAAAIDSLKQSHVAEVASLKQEMTSAADRKFRDAQAAAEQAQKALQDKFVADLKAAEDKHAELVSERNAIKSSLSKASADVMALEASKQEQQEQHQHALAAAVSEAAAAKAAALEALRADLERQLQQQQQQHTQEISQLKEAAANALAEAIRQESSKGQQLLKEAVEQQLALDTEEKTAALAELTQRKAAELAATVGELRDAAARELEAALTKLREAAAVELQSTRQLLEGQLAVANAEVVQAKAELKALEDKFNEKAQQLVKVAEARKDAEREAALAALRDQFKSKIDAAVAEKDEFQALYSKESKLRKSIHNKLLELQGNIRVICRVRPVLEVERRQGAGDEVDVTEFPTPEDILIQRDPQTKSRFEYDRVFPPGSEQQQVFESVQPLCISALDGFNVCIFAYGQTGSGKTFTMEGYGEELGVSPRAIAELFRATSELEEQWEYSLTFSMLEIYNETIRDLLDSNPAKEKLDIRQTPEGNVVPGLTEIVVTSTEQVVGLMTQGKANRAVGSHDMNEHSSRSHSILTIVCRGRNKIDGTTNFGKLHLIDLAGSERVGKTDATGERLKEAQNINKSLSALGDVIAALGNRKSTHVPYRNSKLTFLLQDSLGGNSKVLMFVNVSPAVYNLGETLCSLNFASRCRNIELGQAKRQTGSAGGSDEGGGAGSTVAKSGVRRLSSAPSLSAAAAADGTTAATPSRIGRMSLGTPAPRK